MPSVEYLGFIKRAYKLRGSISNNNDIGLVVAVP